MGVLGSPLAPCSCLDPVCGTAEDSSCVQLWEGGSRWCFQLLKPFMVADALRFAPPPLSAAMLASLCTLPAAAPFPLQSQPSKAWVTSTCRTGCHSRDFGALNPVTPFDNLPEQFPYQACPAVGEFRLWQKLCLPSEGLKTQTRSADSSLSTNREKHGHQWVFPIPAPHCSLPPVPRD